MNHSADFELLDLTEKVPPQTGEDAFPDDEVVHVGAPPSPVIAPLSPVIVPLPANAAFAPLPAPLPMGRAADGTRTSLRSAAPPMPSRAIRHATGTPAPLPSTQLQPTASPAESQEQLDDSWTIRPSSYDVDPEHDERDALELQSELHGDPIDRTDHLDRVDIIEDDDSVHADSPHANAVRAEVEPVAVPAFVAPPLPRPSAAWLARTTSPYAMPPQHHAMQHQGMPTPSPWAQPTPPPAQRYERTQLVRSPYHRAMRMTPTHKRIAIGAIAVASVLGIGFAASRNDGRGSQAAAIDHASIPAPTAQQAIAAPARAAADELVHASKTSALVRVPITSRPSGASVTLVEDGTVSVLGTTPVDVALDPSRSYDIVLTLKDHPTQIAHVRPTANHPLAVDLSNAPTSRAVATTAITSTTPTTPTKAPAATPTPTAPRIAAAAPSPAPAPGSSATAATTATNGVLMISTKPPCQIVIDGKATRLTTPQRALALPAGRHKITLLNPQQKISRTVDVVIAAHASTKLIQDFMAK